MAKSKSRPQPVVWLHKPEGWQRERHITLTAKQRRAIKEKTGQYVTHQRKPMRGKSKCCHEEWLTNRKGKPLRDPDTGYLAKIGCRQVARWERQTYKVFAVLVERFCDKHAEESGAPVRAEGVQK